MKMDRVELRRQNFIPTNAFPYQTPVALQYDSGDYQATLDIALKNADYAGFEGRRKPKPTAAASCVAWAYRLTSRPAASHPQPWSAPSARGQVFMNLRPSASIPQAPSRS